MTFAVTPVPASTAVGTAVPGFIQWQDAGVNVGTPAVVTINIESPLIATRGVGEQRNVLTISVNMCIGGPTWTLQTTGLPASALSPYPVTWAPSGARWTGSAWCIVGYENTNGNQGYVALSTDGLHWTAAATQPPSFGGEAPEYCVNLGNFVTFSGTTNCSFSMDGGNTWQFTSGANAINFSADGILSAGNGAVCGMQFPSTTTGTRVAVATGLATYFTTPHPAQHCVYDGTNHVAVGLGTSSYSPDGVTWSSGGIEVGGFQSVAAGNGIIIGCDSGGNVSRSTNSGQSWTLVPGNPVLGGSAWSIIFAQGEFILVVNAGYVYTSPDGLTWTAATVSGPKCLPYISFNTHWYIGYGANGKYVGLPAGSGVPTNVYATGQC